MLLIIRAQITFSINILVHAQDVIIKTTLAMTK
jgi:hypothetical protein